MFRQYPRLGISNREASLDPEDEVNEFLSRAIDARSVERWKKEYVHPIFLRFRRKEYEKKVRDFYLSQCHFIRGLTVLYPRASEWRENSKTL